MCFQMMLSAIVVRILSAIGILSVINKLKASSQSVTCFGPLKFYDFCWFNQKYSPIFDGEK